MKFTQEILLMCNRLIKIHIIKPSQHCTVESDRRIMEHDNFWFVPRQYSSASEHIHSMFADCPH